MDRRKMLALLGASPALVAGTPSFVRADATTTPKAAPRGASYDQDNGAVAVLNPAIATSFANRVPLAPRLDSLDGKTIYLVDFDWGGMGQNDSIQQEMQAWFAQHMPSVKTIIKIKKGNFVTDDPGLWKEIAAAHGDGVIIGVAG